MGGEALLSSSSQQSSASYPKLAHRPVGQQIRSIYTERLRQFTANGQYEGHNLVSCGFTVPYFHTFLWRYFKIAQLED
jgi:alpha-mannosidase